METVSPELLLPKLMVTSSADAELFPCPILMTNSGDVELGDGLAVETLVVEGVVVEGVAVEGVAVDGVVVEDTVAEGAVVEALGLGVFSMLMMMSGAPL